MLQILRLRLLKNVMLDLDLCSEVLASGNRPTYVVHDELDRHVGGWELVRSSTDAASRRRSRQAKVAPRYDYSSHLCVATRLLHEYCSLERKLLRRPFVESLYNNLHMHVQ